jgi:hypothetical protein
MKTALIACLALALAACSKNIQTTEAVRQAILDDVQARKDKTGVDPSKMDIGVSNVSFAENEARANVAFTIKGGPEGAGMQMSYVLKREGVKWVVTGRQMSIAAPHGEGGLPPSEGK